MWFLTLYDSLLSVNMGFKSKESKTTVDGKSKLPPPHVMEEYEVLNDQSKNDLKAPSDDQNEEKWVKEFESWSNNLDKDQKKEVKKSTLIGIDEESIIKEKVLIIYVQNSVDDKAAEMFAEMNLAPSLEKKPDHNENDENLKNTKEYIDFIMQKYRRKSRRLGR